MVSKRFLCVYRYKRNENKIKDNMYTSEQCIHLTYSTPKPHV